MPKFIADFHIHSKYSRACSRSLCVAELAKWAKIKGIGVLGTGDFTHPLWMQELKNELRETESGLYEHADARFILTAEVSTLFYRNERAHQIHHILFAPGIAAAERVNRELAAFGNLAIDGRPILRMTPAQLVSLMLGADSRCAVVPAHAWTPHFSIFGSRSGFDAVEECFEDQARHIFALETGLSSDPAMNWRLSQLDKYALISNSDSHSARRIGREANVFDCEYAYDAILGALRRNDRSAFVSTIEFFPEQGKYHLDGHRACQARLTPQQTKEKNFLCPGCGRKVTVGVMHRVDDLADRPEGQEAPTARPFKRLVPLDDLIAKALRRGVGTQAVEREYVKLIDKCGTEFGVLLDASEEVLRAATQAPIAKAVLRMRRGEVVVEPGYDGEYGKVRLFEECQSALT